MPHFPKKDSYSVAVIGAGQIGQPIYEFLPEFHLIKGVRLYDAAPRSSEVHPLDVDLTDVNLERLRKVVEAHDVIVSALPYHKTITVAEVCASVGGKLYVDLTEDLASGEAAKQLNFISNRGTVMVPHCGLAPGAVSIIAASLMRSFERTDEVKIRVGALPVACDNALQYHRSWSTVGLVNEYTKPCAAVRRGRLVTLEPLGDLTTVGVAGAAFESFNTSGGSGTLPQSVTDGRFGENISLTYQTMRYLGHRDKISFLLDGLGFRRRLEELITLLDREVPRTFHDVVVILIQVTGRYHGEDNVIKTYFKRIYGNGRHSAIQLTTAGGAVAIVNYLLDAAWKGNLDAAVRGPGPDGVVQTSGTGWVAVEDIPLDSVAFDDAWKPYVGHDQLS